MKKKTRGREKVIDTVTFMSNLKVVQRRPRWMIFEKTDYFQKVISLGKSHPFLTKLADFPLNRSVFGFL